LETSAPRDRPAQIDKMIIQITSIEVPRTVQAPVSFT